MPHHKQFVKSLRQDAKRRLANRSQRARLRHAISDQRDEVDPTKAAALLPDVASLLDRAAKTHLIHPRKADRLKSRLALALRRKQAAPIVAPKATGKAAPKA